MAEALTTYAEQYMGVFQGHVWGKGKALIGSDRNGPGAMDEPESPEAVMERALAWWNDTIVGTTASCVLITSHGAWIRLLLLGLLEDKAVRAALGVHVGRCLNTGVSIVEIPRDRGRGTLLQYGNVVHLLRGADDVDVVNDNADENGIQ
jgi:probable phosphoglycerate mutase